MDIGEGGGKNVGIIIERLAEKNRRGTRSR